VNLAVHDFGSACIPPTSTERMMVRCLEHAFGISFATWMKNGE